jgi:outer membrane protein OmpA-like peptidoglycan-associated protein
LRFRELFDDDGLAARGAAWHDRRARPSLREAKRLAEPARASSLRRSMMDHVRLGDGPDTILVFLGSDRIWIHDRERAQRLLRHVLDAPDGETQFRAIAGLCGVGDDVATDDAVELVADRIVGGEVALFELERRLPQMDPPPRGEPLHPSQPGRIEDPIARPTWLGLEVVNENGTQYPGAAFVLTLPDGGERLERLDAQSRWRADDIPAGPTCRVRFEPALRSHAGTEGATFAATATESIELPDRGRTPVAIATAAEHRLVVPRPTTHVAQLEDVHFELARAIVLPIADPEASTRSPLEILASVLAFAATTSPSPMMIIAGHTDTTGSGESNRTLSEARAKNVELLLRGDKAAWAKHSLGHYAVSDLQLIYKWASARELWPCDPGPVDNDLGEHTKDATTAFRAAFNRERAGGLPEAGEIGVKDWEAIFELYTDAMNLMLSDLGDVATLSQRLRVASVLGCGEQWPREKVELDGFESRANRRVDLWFVDEDEVPELPGSPIGKEIYGASRFRLRPVPMRPLVQAVRLQLRDATGAPRPGVEYEVIGVRGAHVGTSDEHAFTETFTMNEGEEGLLVVGEDRVGLVLNSPAADDMAFAQSVLNALGFYAGATSGAMNRLTRAALGNFQWVAGLKVTGDLDAETFAALRKAAVR